MRKILYFSTLFLLLILSLTFFLLAADTSSKNGTEESALNVARFTGGRTYLLLGLSEEPYVAETVMLGHLDEDGKGMKLLQLPSDTLTAEGDLGSIFQKGSALVGATDKKSKIESGATALADFLENAFSLTVEGYAALTGEDFAALVDAVGGIPVKLPHAIDQPGENGEALSLREGETLLSGALARELVLAKGLVIKEESGETNGQRFVLGALFQKLRFHSSPRTLAIFLRDAHRMIVTDIALGEALALGGKLLTVKSEALLYAEAEGEPLDGHTVIPKDTLLSAAAFLEGRYDGENHPFCTRDATVEAVYNAPARKPFTPKAAKKETA